MKNIVFILTLVFTVATQAQKPITKMVGEFTTLKVYDLINVELIQSKENKIEIFGKDASDVLVNNKNGTLKIKMRIENIFDGNKTEVKLYLTHIDVLDANEGAFISSNETFKQYELDLRAQEGGSIKLDVDTKINEVRADTGGIVELTGQSRHQNIILSTGAIFKGKTVKSQSTNISIKAGGEAELQADKLLDIKIIAGGDVYIFNQPEQVTESKTLGGRIKYVE